MSEIGIIANPHSKMNKRNPELSAALAYILGEQGYFENTQSLGHLRYVARKFYEKKIKILAINGGDGTLSQTLTAFIKEYGDTPLPKICVLKGGTINIVAQNLGIKGTPEQVLYRLVNSYSLGKPMQIASTPSLSVGDHYGFIYADGLATRFLRAFYRKKTGRLGSLILAAKLYAQSIFKTKSSREMIFPQNLDIKVDQQEPKSSQSLLSICTTMHALPLGFIDFRLGKQTDTNHLRCLSFEIDPNEFWWKLPIVFTCDKSGLPMYSRAFDGEKLTLSGMSEYTLDGELFENGGSEVSIERGPMIDFIKI